MANRFFTFIRNMSITYKLFLTFALLISFPFLIYMFVNSYSSSKNTEKQAVYSANQMLLQSKTYLESKIDLINNTMNMISYNDVVQQLMKQSPEKYLDNWAIWNYDLEQVTKQFFYLQPADDILHIRLYIGSGIIEISPTSSFLDINKVKNELWYKKLTSSSLPIQWLSGKYFPEKEKEKYLSVVKKIKNSENLNNLLSIIRVDLKYSTFEKICIQTKYTNSSLVFLMNKNNEILNSTLDNTSIDSDLLSSISNIKPHQDSGGSFSGSTKLNTGKVLIGIENIKGTDWKLVQVIPYKDILILIKQQRLQMILIILIVIILALPVSYFIASSSTKSFRALISHMKKIETGNFNISILPSNNDEIGQLTRNFNHMFTKIAMLLEEQYMLGQEIKNIELKALQAQINPHFLYNTLDQINWMAMEFNAPKICSIVNELSTFYKLGLKNGENIVTIGNELEHVRAYVYIQNIRFSNVINLEINVPNDILQYNIPKITLQPLVENSILHGMLESESGSGTISISGSIEDNVITLVVKDDGVGMTEEKVHSVLESIVTSDFHGYGTKNINDKLTLLYGKNYGLIYESTLGLGTTVSVKFPAIM